MLIDGPRPIGVVPVPRGLGRGPEVELSSNP
jgi:hypothetical protein